MWHGMVSIKGSGQKLGGGLRGFTWLIQELKSNDFLNSVKYL